MMLMMMIQSRLCHLAKSDPSSTCHPSTTPAIFKRARVQPPEPESDEESESEDINHDQLGSQPPFFGNVPLPHDVPNSPSSPRSDITELWPPEGASLRNGTDDEDGEPGEQTDTPLDGLSRWTVYACLQSFLQRRPHELRSPAARRPLRQLASPRRGHQLRPLHQERRAAPEAGAARFCSGVGHGGHDEPGPCEILARRHECSQGRSRR